MYTNAKFCRLYGWLLLALLAGTGVRPAQAQAVRWERSLGGGGGTAFFDGCTTADGGYILVGRVLGRSIIMSDSTHGMRGNVLVVKYSVQGTVQWGRRYGANRDSRGVSIVAAPGGGYAVGALAYSDPALPRRYDQTEPGRGGNDYWLLRLDAQGHKLWDHTFGSSASDELSKVWATADGGYLLAGSSDATAAGGDKTQPGFGFKDYWVVKTDAQGHKLWDRTLGGDRPDNLANGIPTADGGCLLAGQTFSSQNGTVSQPNTGPVANYDEWLVKLDAQGTVQWDRRYGGEQSEAALGLCQNSDGGYIVAGVSSSGQSGTHTQPSRGGIDTWVLRLTAQGNKVWDYRFGTADGDYVSGFGRVVPAPGGGYLVPGSSSGGIDGDKTQANRGVSDYWLLRLSSTGSLLWNRTYGGNGGDDALNLLRLSNGNLLFFGASTSGISGDRTRENTTIFNDSWNIELDSAGLQPRDVVVGSAPYNTQTFVGRARNKGLFVGGNSNANAGYDKSESAAANQSQIWLLKRDSLGVAQWDAALGGDKDEYLGAVEEEPNGNILVAGTAHLVGAVSRQNRDADFVSYRLDATGTNFDRRVLGGPGDDWLGDAHGTPDGGLVLGGTSRSGAGRDKTEASRGGADFWVIKRDDTPATEWDHRYGGTGLDSLVTVLLTADGGYLLAGSSTSPVGGDLTEPSRGGADYWLVKVDALGAVQWQHRYGGPANDWLAAASPSPDGGYLLAGTTFSGVGGELTEASRGRRDLWVLKVDALGSLQWQHRYGGSGNEYAATVEADPDGGFVVGASTTSAGGSGEVSQPSRGGTDYWLLRLSAQGTVLWDKRLGGSGEDVLAGVAPRPGYGYAVGGTSDSPAGSGEHQLPGRGAADYWTLLLGARRVPAPVISSFVPGSGVSGTVVTLTGTGFTGTSSVTFNGTPAPGFAVGNGGTTITVAVPFGASTGLVAVTANGTGTSATPFVVTLPDLVVSSAQAVQGTYNNVRITGPATGGAGVATLAGPLAVQGSLLVQAGGSLLANCQPLTGAGSFALAAGATLGICAPAGIAAAGASGTVQLTGPRSFSPDARYVYNGTVPQTTGSGLPAQVRELTLDNPTGLALTQALAVAQVLRLSRGDLAVGSQALTLLSAASGTALVDNTGGAVLGPATVQRYVDGSRNAGTGYRHLAAPVAAATVGSLATAGFAPEVSQGAAYNASATPGLVLPFPTVYGYDERRLPASLATGYTYFDRGWVAPTSLADPLAVGLGYTVQLAAGLTVAFTGPLHNGPYTRPLTRAAAPAALAAESGWHLLGNPYPSPLDWRLVPRPATVDDALYVFESSGPYAGQYRARVNGLGASPLIGSGQGFFVRVNTPGATPTLAFGNAARLTVFGTEPALGRPAADVRPLLRLTLAADAPPPGPGGTAPAADAAYLYFEAGATPGPDARFDAAKLANPDGLGLATLAPAPGGPRPLAIDGRPPLGTQPLLVPLAVAVPRPGRYALTAAEVSHFAPGTALYLLDALAGTRQPLTAGCRYPVQLAGSTASGRFAIECRPGTSLATAAETLAAQVQVFPNPAAGRFALLLPPQAGGRADLRNVLGQVVLTCPIAPAGQPGVLAVEVPHLAPGVYQLTVTLAGAAVTRRLILE